MNNHIIANVMNLVLEHDKIVEVEKLDFLIENNEEGVFVVKIVACDFLDSYNAFFNFSDLICWDGEIHELFSDHSELCSYVSSILVALSMALESLEIYNHRSIIHFNII